MTPDVAELDMDQEVYRDSGSRQLADAVAKCAGQTLHVYSPDGSTYVHEITSVRISIHFCQISSRSDLKGWSLWLFLKTVAPTRSNGDNNEVDPPTVKHEVETDDALKR